MNNSASLPAELNAPSEAFSTSENTAAQIIPSAPMEGDSTVSSVSNGNAPATPNSEPTAKLKQVKTKITERRKKNGDGSESKSWDVQVGSAVARVYFTPSGERELFTVSYWVDGKRKRSVLATLEKAIAEAKKAGTELTKGNLGAAELSNAERAASLRALQLLAPVGVSLELAAAEYASAITKLKGRATLATAVEFYLKRHAVAVEPRRVADVIQECLASKRQDKLSERYVKQLEYDLKRFAARFKNFIGDVAGRDIDTWLRELGVSGRTRNNIRMSVQTLMGFAKAKRYLEKDHDEMESVPLAKELDGAIEIFTPGEMAEVLAVVSPKTLPFYALGAFAGIRHAEIQRLDWAQVQRKAGIIEIRAGMAKTASRRVIPILPNLRKWLAKHWQEAGPVCTYANMGEEILEVTRAVNAARRAAWAKAKRVSKATLLETERRAKAESREQKGGKSTPHPSPLPGRGGEGAVPPGAETAALEGWAPFAWKHNALRHSFISYRVAQTQDVAKVSLEAGNSPQMIFKHYRELVRPQAAKEWFSITPKS